MAILSCVRSAIAAPTLAMVTLITSAPLAAAQRVDSSSRRVIRGTVVDARDRAVPLVMITVTGGPSTTSDDSGRFRLVVPRAERVVLDVRRVGYMPSRFALVDGGDTTVSVLLLPAVRTLVGVEVNDTPLRSSGLRGFEQRMVERDRGSGSGHFFTAKDIEALHPMRATQIVESTPSIVVRRTSGDRFAIYGKLTRGGECPATVYLDGTRLSGSGDALMGKDRRGRPVIMRSADGQVEIDQFVDPSELAGVEVYARGLFAPVQFQPNEDAAKQCAIVIFWTKHA